MGYEDFHLGLCLECPAANINERELIAARLTNGTVPFLCERYSHYYRNVKTNIPVNKFYTDKKICYRFIGITHENIL